MCNLLSRNIFLPLSDKQQGLSIGPKLAFLEKSQFWSRAELETFQQERLQWLVKHAYESVPWYRETFKRLKLTPADIATVEDLHKIPIISKDIIRKEVGEKFVSTAVAEKDKMRFFSSGSTGEPFLYYLSRDAYSMKYAAAIRGWQWMGYEMGEPYAKLSQNKRFGWKKKLQDKINRSFYYFIPDLKPSTLHNIIKQLQRDKPIYIRCYPDPLFFMARIMQQENISFDWVKAINTTGNTLYAEARNLIEKQFGCKVHDGYSCEGSALFYQVEGYNGYLGSMETAITEVVDEQNQSVEIGKAGRHITTELWNPVMPFIRYDTRDLIVADAQEPKAGRNLYAIQKIAGRESDILVAPDGNLLIVHLFTIYFEYFESIRQFQVEQTDETTFIFRLVVNTDFTSAIEKQIKDYWQTFLGTKAIVSIEIHNEIPLLYSGKRRFLIRNKEIPLF